MVKEPNQPILHDVRILDFTWALAGPYATRLLADFGAEVIKVQSPLMENPDDSLMQGYYNTWNRSKLAITLNMNKPEGVALAKRLAGICDAVVENFTPRVMANWGLDYENLKKVKPDIIMVSMSVMGGKSPLSYYSGYGPTVHALSGMVRLTSFPGRPPIGPGFSYADHVAGLYASIALLGALEERRKTGKGRHVDISELDVMAGLLEGAAQEPVGNDSLIAAPHNVYRCKGKNRWCAIAVFTEEEWRGLKQALGNPSWAEDGKFATVSGRRKNKKELDRLLSGWTQKHTAEAVMSLLQKNGVAAGIVQDASELAKDPQLRVRGFFIEDARTPLIDASPIRMSVSAAEYGLSAPEPGRDNDYVYGELLGISRRDIAELKKQGVI
ncbi:MAG: CoA transferase [Dehalococcoidales bacterium]|nr:CoA transferase [Dehalococcoidales bacterium]